MPAALPTVFHGFADLGDRIGQEQVDDQHRGQKGQVPVGQFQLVKDPETHRGTDHQQHGGQQHITHGLGEPSLIDGLAGHFRQFQPGQFVDPFPFPDNHFAPFHLEKDRSHFRHRGFPPFGGLSFVDHQGRPQQRLRNGLDGSDFRAGKFESQQRSPFLDQISGVVQTVKLDRRRDSVFLAGIDMPDNDAAFGIVGQETGVGQDAPVQKVRDQVQDGSFNAIGKFGFSNDVKKALLGLQIER